MKKIGIVLFAGIATFLFWEGGNLYATTAPSASLSANGSSSITVSVGDTISYSWSSTNGVSFSSSYTSSCGSGPWVANSASGGTSGTVASNQAGCSYSISYTVTNSVGSATDSISVTVRPASGTTAPSTTGTGTRTNCTGFENDPACRPEWAKAREGCVPGSILIATTTTGGVFSQCLKTNLNGQIEVVRLCSELNQTGPCNPGRVNPHAAQGAVSGFIEEARRRGYTDISCGETITQQWPGIDSNTGFNTFLGFSTRCAINGCPMDPTMMMNRDIPSGNIELMWNTLRDTLREEGGRCEPEQMGTAGTAPQPAQTPRAPQTTQAGSAPVDTFSTSVLGILNRITTDLRAQLNQTGNQTPQTGTQTNQTQGDFATNVLGLMNRITEQLRNQLDVARRSGGAITSAPETQRPVSPTSPVSVSEGAGTLTFRYLRLDTTEEGWVSWREIEAYNQNGTMVRPVSSTASCIWCNHGPIPGMANPRVDAAPDKAYDGNVHTVWNAGETGENCNILVGGRFVPCHVRKAWIQLDYGSVQTFSRLRALQNGNTLSEVTRVLVSNDGINFRELTTFRAPMMNMEWIEFPTPTPAGPPSVTAWVLGPGHLTATSSNTTIRPFQSVMLNYTTQNADFVTVQARMITDTTADPNNIFRPDPHAPCGTITSRVLTGWMVGNFPRQMEERNFTPYSDCWNNTTKNIKITAHQRGGATASSEINVRIVPDLVSTRHTGDERARFVTFQNATQDILPFNARGEALNRNPRAGETVFYRFIAGFHGSSIDFGDIGTRTATLPTLNIRALNTNTLPFLTLSIETPRFNTADGDGGMREVFPGQQLGPGYLAHGTFMVRVNVAPNAPAGLYPIEVEGVTPTRVEGMPSATETRRANFWVRVER